MKQKMRWMLAFCAVLAAMIMPARGQAPAGLVGFWKGEGNVQDTVGTNNGSIAVPPQLVGYGPGEVGQAFVLTGGWISVPNDPSLEPASTLTLQAWVKGTPPGAYKYIMSKSRPGFAAYALYTAGNGGMTFFVANAGALTLSPSADPSIVWDGAWHQVTGTYDGATLRLFVDGTEVGSGTPATGNINYSATVNGGAMILGNDPTFSTAYVGSLDEVKIFNRAFTAQDASDTYTNFSSAAATNGLVSWYKGEGNFLDSWGSNDGTPLTTKTVLYAPGKVGQAFFPQLGCAVVPESSVLEPATVTVQAWVNSVAPNTFRYILNKVGSATGVSYGLYTGEAQGLIFLITQTDGSLVLSPSVPGAAVWDGSWHLVTGVWDGTTAHVYLDGVEQGTGTVTVNGLTLDNSSPGPLIFGDYRSAGGLPFVGLIDEIQIFNRALSPQEIVATMAGTNLVSWWNAASNANDVVGTNNGTLLGNASYTSSRSLNNNAFRTTGGVVKINDSASLQPANLTLEAQVRAGSPGANKYVVSKSDTASAASYAFYTGPSGGLQFYVNLNGTGKVFSPDAGTNIWDGFYHIVDGSYDGAKVHLYVDGKEVGSGTPATGAVEYGTAQSSGALLFGDFSDVPSAANFAGSVDEIKLYRTALTAAQVDQNAFKVALIVQPPQSQPIKIGDKTALSVWAQGALPLKYQWMFNGTNLSGATKSSLLLTNGQASQEGSYAVLITGPTVTYTNGVFGKAFQLAGGVVDIPNQSAYESQNFSIQLYARGIAPGTYQYLLAKDRAPIGQIYNDSYGLETAGDGGLTWLIILAPPPDTTAYGVVTASVGPSIWDGNWHQVTATWDGQFASLYVDGVIAQSVDSFGGDIAYGVGSANGDLLLGDILTSSTAFHFNGDVDQVKYFDHALGDADVLDTYVNPNGAAATNGLVNWYKADGNALDSQGSNDATVLPIPGSMLSPVAIISPPAATLVNPRVAGGNFQATLIGPDGVGYVILSSTNLTSWTRIYTNVVPFTFSNPLAVGGKQYYRAVSQ